MFERYSEPARRALFFSRYEASVLGSLAIETEHLLLGILKDREPVIARLLAAMNLAGDEIRQVVYDRIGAPAPQMDMSVEIRFSNDAKQVLEYTAEEASRLLHRYIGSEHLLLGVLRLERGLAWDVLREQGLSLTRVREALVMHVSATSPPPPEIAGLVAAMLPRRVERVQRSAGVYLMTALDDPSPGRRISADDGGAGVFSSFSTVGFSSPADRPPDGRIHSIGPISMWGITLSEFVPVLEAFLDSPVIDDTGLTGVFDIELHGEHHDKDALIAALRDQLGLVLTTSLL